ncbi:MAG: BrnT family toxin [Planctomycetota bacterium]
MRCEWDQGKSEANRLKHGLGLDEAARLFDLPPHLILEEYDLDHSAEEDRIRSIGPIERGVILVVSTERDEGEVIRLISARLATAQERRRYADMIAGVQP